ncbi:MAG: isochorismatase family protein [Halobacteriales archaeon]|nr:isochorismatase family protein [Halobacteriales archaeon]
MPAATPPALASRPAPALALPPDAVLLTIDMQQGFDGFPGRNNPAVDANAAALQAAWRAAGRALWHVRHDSREARSVFRPGLPGNAFRPATAPRPGEPVFAKSVHSAFIGTGLGERLDREGRRTLVLCGIQTNYCVATTARMAGNLGYTAYVAGDACATFPQRLLSGAEVDAQVAHDLALAELHGEFATVVATADVLRVLRASAPR